MIPRSKEAEKMTKDMKASSIKFHKGTAKRLFDYIFEYKLQLAVVIVCIILSALASALSSLFTKTLIDDYIEPLLIETVPDFSGLFRAILMMAAIYAIGIVATFLYNRIMVVIAQGVLKKIRDRMFSHMQTLPIKYFDTHTHGDIMSHYTNDTDTLRQMIAQNIPQMFSSIVTIVAVLASMLVLSVWLTIFVVACVLIMLQITK